MRTTTINNIEVTIIEDNMSWTEGKTKIGRAYGKKILCIICKRPKLVSNNLFNKGLSLAHQRCITFKHGLERDEDLVESRHVIINCFISQLKANAKGRNLECKLTREEIEILIFSNCVYCGRAPSRKYYDRKIMFGGIDRTNNKLGYISENCVPCCVICNIAKGSKPLEEFLDWLDKLVEFRNRMKEIKL